MMGGPIDLTPFGAVLQGVGVLYWLAVLVVLGLVMWKVSGWLRKLLTSLAVLAAMVTPVALRVLELRDKQAQVKGRLDAAMVRFETRCKSAGEKITRTVENVEGVVWMKWREKISNADNFADQFKLNDPYGQDCGAEDCILNLLRVTKGADFKPDVAQKHSKGYRFVEATDPKDGQRFRYTAVIKSVRQHTPEQREQYKGNSGGVDPGVDIYDIALEAEPIASYAARYGITWDDISSREDREHWIAGSSLKVIDLQANQVIAERVGYMIDRGQGSQAGFRSPWLYAEYTACPAFDRSESNSPIKASRSRNFVREVLKFKQEE